MNLDNMDLEVSITELKDEIAGLAEEKMDLVIALAGRVSSLIGYLGQHGITGFESPLTGEPPLPIVNFRQSRAYLASLGRPEKVEKLEKGAWYIWPGLKAYLTAAETRQFDDDLLHWDGALS